MKLVAMGMALALAGCPKEHPPSGIVPPVASRDAPAPIDAPPPIDARPPAVPYRAAAVAIVSDEIAPAVLDWDHATVTEAELEDALDDVGAARQRLGRFIVRFADGRFDPYDARKHQLRFVGPGLAGIRIDPPVAFRASPSITRGEMPLGGHVNLDVDAFRGAIAIDAAGAKALLDANATDPLVTDFLVELEGPITVDGADLVRGTLVGVRIVREGTHEQFLEGTPTKLGR